MGIIIFAVLLLLPSRSFSNGISEEVIKKFQQRDYHIDYERTDVVRYDKTYIEYLNARGFKYNRTSFGINGTFTFKVDFNRDLDVVFQVYKFMSNEYRYFPIRMQIHVCDILDNNLMGYGMLIQCGNFAGCPIKKGSYTICNFMQDESRFPPLIPTGRYMVEFQGLFFGKEIFVIRGYSSITRPLSKK